MIYTSDDLAEMTPAQIYAAADREAYETTKQLWPRPVNSIMDGIRRAFQNAARLQIAANTETDTEEAEALRREAAAARETIRTIFEA